jgi:hypothetical protein
VEAGVVVPDREEQPIETPMTQPMCCLAPMRQLSVGLDPLSVFICDRCRDRRWVVGGHELKPELAQQLLERVHDEHRQ